MGSSDEGVQKSREIEKLIRQDEKRMSKEVKLLLLGASSLSLSGAGCHRDYLFW